VDRLDIEKVADGRERLTLVNDAALSDDVIKLFRSVIYALA